MDCKQHSNAIGVFGLQARLRCIDGNLNWRMKRWTDSPHRQKGVRNSPQRPMVMQGPSDGGGPPSTLSPQSWVHCRSDEATAVTKWTAATLSFCLRPVRWGLTHSVEGCAGCFFDLKRGELIDDSMQNANQKCACEPCGCSVSPEKAFEKEGKIYCSQPCADGHAGDDQCCSSCDCCWLFAAVALLRGGHSAFFQGDHCYTANDIWIPKYPYLNTSTGVFS